MGGFQGNQQSPEHHGVDHQPHSLLLSDLDELDISAHAPFLLKTAGQAAMHKGQRIAGQDLVAGGVLLKSAVLTEEHVSISLLTATAATD